MGDVLYRVRGYQKPHPLWSYGAVVYELNVRQFTAQGTFLAAVGRLRFLRDLGVDILWLMPIFPVGVDGRKGSLGSGYSVMDYGSVNPEFGSMDDFRVFMAEARKLGFRVILDWVAAHTSRDCAWVSAHPGWYDWDADGQLQHTDDWTDTARLNYSAEVLADAMISQMQYWVQKHGVSGFRCDMAMLVPMSFWQRAISELSDGPEELFMLAEAEGPEFHSAFDATYGWEMHKLFWAISRGESNCYDLGKWLMAENHTYEYSAFRLYFTENHDENSWSGSAVERFGVLGSQCFAALTFVLPGVPLIYNGQEAGLDRSLSFFEHDPIPWDELSASGRADRFGVLYTELCRLRRTHPALMAGCSGGDLVGLSNSRPWDLFGVRRVVEGRSVVAFFNLSGAEYTATIDDPMVAGHYAELLSTEIELTAGQEFHFDPWEFRIFHN